jgi:altronate dehydratase small subunit
MSNWDAIQLDNKDQIATALKNISSGETIQVKSGEIVSVIDVLEDVPLCHKFAIANIAAGDAVHKYGEPIGAASDDIEIGHHVHIHNLKSLRASNK